MRSNKLFKLKIFKKVGFALTIANLIVYIIVYFLAKNKIFEGAIHPLGLVILGILLVMLYYICNWKLKKKDC